LGAIYTRASNQIAMLDRDTGVIVERTLKHEGEAVRGFPALSVKDHQLTS
jgi:hypothetical protein